MMLSKIFKNLSKDDVSIAGREWYHQRFDGSPIFLSYIGEAEIKKEKRKPSGTEADIRVCFYSHGKADWYISQKDIDRGVKVLVGLAKKGPAISSKLLTSWQKDEEAFEKFFWKEFPRINLKKLTNSELLKLWEKQYRLAVNRFTSSAVIDHFALGTDELIQEMLKKELKSQGGVAEGSVFTEIFSTATAPVHQSFINRAEVDLLKIALSRSKQNLEDYQKKYFWTRNNYYSAKVLSVAHFKEEVRTWRQSKKDLSVQLRQIEQTPKVNRQKKQKLFRQYRFSPFLKTLLKISEDFTRWQDERKKATYLNIHIGSQILREVARRVNYDLDELKYAVPSEVTGILRKQKPGRKVLQSRRQNSVFIQTRAGYVIKVGKEVGRIKKLMLGSEKHDKISDFRGLSASMGRVVGRVKVVKSATEVSKVKPGDVLVAVMTRPDYIVAMKKAAAIVTNEGGITSHAAIVSREMGIPCIIGTKIATEVLKDGDLVEVNANHGWVRKVKS